MKKGVLQGTISGKPCVICLTSYYGGGFLKKSMCILMLVLLIMSSACSMSTYNNNEEIAQVFQTYRSAFEDFVAVATSTNENEGVIHRLRTTEEQSADCDDSGYMLREEAGLHFHLLREISDAEIRDLADTALALMEKVNIESISFSHEAVRFHLKDTNEYSWDPMVVYWRTNHIDKERIGYGEEILYLSEHWYACIIAR